MSCLQACAELEIPSLEQVADKEPVEQPDEYFEVPVFAGKMMRAVSA